MSAHVTPSKDAIEQRAQRERSIRPIAQKAADHIVGQLEPRFSDAFAKARADTFTRFVLECQTEYDSVHVHVIDNTWFEQNGRILVTDTSKILAMSSSIIKQQLEEKYGIVASVTLYNGGAPEFVFEWYNVEICTPRKKKSLFWRFWNL